MSASEAIKEAMSNMTGADIDALKQYVNFNNGFQNKAESTVLLNVTHSNLKARFMEIRLDRHMTVDQVKIRLESHTGTSVTSMQLWLHDESGRPVVQLEPDSRKLGFFSPRDYMTIHVVDTDPFSLSMRGGLEDVSLVKKFELSDEEYSKRENTYRNWKNDKLAEDPTWTLEKEMKRKKDPNWQPTSDRDDDFGADDAAKIAVGHRCEVAPGGRRGEVKFVGKASSMPSGFWVGIELDEPMGKNNGTVKGIQYFECGDNYGVMVRPDKVEVGDFPPIDEFADLEDEI